MSTAITEWRDAVVLACFLKALLNVSYLLWFFCQSDTRVYIAILPAAAIYVWRC